MMPSTGIHAAGVVERPKTHAASLIGRSDVIKDSNLTL